MIIELIGMPGSGKTYYIKNLTAKNKSNYVTRDDIKKIKMYFRLNFFLYLIKHWQTIFLFNIGTILNIQLNLKKSYAFLNGVFKTFLQYYIITEKLKEKNIVMDEGLFQRALSVFCYNKRILNKFLLKKTIKSIQKEFCIDKIIHINMDLEKCYSRCLERKDGLSDRFKNLKEAAVKKKFQSFSDGINIIKKRINNIQLEEVSGA